MFVIMVTTHSTSIPCLPSLRVSLLSHLSSKSTLLLLFWWERDAHGYRCLRAQRHVFRSCDSWFDMWPWEDGISGIFPRPLPPGVTGDDPLHTTWRSSFSKFKATHSVCCELSVLLSGFWARPLGPHLSTRRQEPCVGGRNGLLLT